MELRYLQQEILKVCVDDDCDLRLLIRVVREESPHTEPQALQALCLQVIHDLHRAGYIHAGSANPGHFDVWDIPTEQLVSDIKRAWDNLGRDPEMWEIVWFRATLDGIKKLNEDVEPNVLMESQDVSSQTESKKEKEA
jgi:hypothetical protein